MALTKEKKGAIVEKMTRILRGAKAAVFVSFRGVSVAEVAAMRRALRARGIGYTVVKKTLARRALDTEKLAGEQPEFPGEFAIAYGDDDVEPAKGIAEFAKKFDGRVSPVGGILESRYISKGEVVALSLVPSRHTLYGMFANLMNSPMQGTVTVLSGVMRSCVVALNQIAEKKS